MDAKYTEHKHIYYVPTDPEYQNFSPPKNCIACGSEELVVYRPYGIVFCTVCNKPHLPEFPKI